MANLNSPNVSVSRDEEGHVRSIDMTMEPFSTEALTAPTPRGLADEYLRQFAPDIGLESEAVADFAAPVGDERVDELTRLHFIRDKTVANMAVVVYEQTYHGLPVWGSTVAVRVNTEPMQVVGATNESHYELEVANPGLAHPQFDPSRITTESLTRTLGLDPGDKPEINSKRRVVYQYDPDERVDPESVVDEPTPFQTPPPTLSLPSVTAEEFTTGVHYVVTEVMFTLSVPDWEGMHWRAFIEPESGAVLYLRALVAGISGFVFAVDPVTQGCADCTGATSETTLNSFRSGVPLPGLSQPSSGTQHLSGEFVKLEDVAPPNISPPTQPADTDFDYSAVTNDFTGVNTYYHCDYVYRLIQTLGINVADYFEGTTFPVPTDPRGKGDAVNASANGNSTGTGMGSFRFGLVEAGTPVGIATALRVVLHEFGHALLWDHVNSPNFGFAHSAGDSMAAILNDPSSQAPDPGLTFPFLTNSNPGLIRRHDRKIADGWAWFGPQYNTQYQGEQVLSTTLFRAYQSIGGASTDLADKQLASEYMFYLIVKSCGMMTQMTTDPAVYAAQLELADRTTPDFQGMSGGMAYKVIRWSFEQQGLYQAPGTPLPITQPGLPPEVDVYIDDGRAGGYQWIDDWKNTTAIWNRNAADGGSNNQTPLPGIANYLYIQVSNRGTQPAENVGVSGYQSTPGSAGNWPDDWNPTTTASLSATGPIPPHGSIVLGPYEWTPVAGDIGVLMVASAQGDVPVVDNPQIPNIQLGNSRLVPIDNNIAQRNYSVTQPADSKS